MKIDKIKFKDRADATQQLLDVLPISSMQLEKWVVLAISPGAIQIASTIAKVLGAKLDYLFTHKIFTSKNQECEIAIVTETQEVVIHEELMRSFNLDIQTIYRESNEKYDTILKQYKKQYRQNKDIASMQDANVLLVDEGLNTGLTMMACIKSVINAKAKSICVAVPVLPEVTINDIETIADDLYYVSAPAHFVSIDFYYENLENINMQNI